MEKQKTVKSPTSFIGVGLHTGNKSKITFNPAPVNYGIRFVRTDVNSDFEIPALVDYVIDLSRGTTLGKDGIEVHTVEHVLAALTGLGIDNCRIELSANEPPVGDGSAMPYVNAILEAGIEVQDKEVEVFNLKEMIRFKNDEKEIEIVALPNEDYRLTVLVDYANPALGSQHTGLFDFKNEFVPEFASARTFCFLTELQSLHKMGLIKGGSLESGVVIEDKQVSDNELQEIKDIFALEKAPVKGSNGILNNTELRYRNEPARHKLLDIIGDLTLVGVRINAQILAARPGHASNIEVAKKIREQYLKYKTSDKLKPNVDNYYNIQQILEILPHRYPFLLVDRVLEYNEQEQMLTALKNVSFNEPYFPGHFPGKPIMPGVIILEAMAQVGGILIYTSQVKGITDGKKAFFMSINNAKFRKPVVPGDQLIMKLKLVQKKLGAFKFEATAHVDGAIVAQAELQAALVEG